MRHLFKILLHTVTIFLLLVCAATMVRWISSYYRSDEIISAKSGGRLWWLKTYPGLLEVQIANGWPDDEPIRWIRPGKLKTKRPCIAFLGYPPAVVTWHWLSLNGFYGSARTHCSPDRKAI